VLAPTPDFAHFAGMGVETSDSGEHPDGPDANICRISGALSCHPFPIR